MLRLDAVFLGVFVLVTAAILWFTAGFPDTGEQFGPALFPQILALLLALLSGVLALRWLLAVRTASLTGLEVPAGFVVRASLLGLALVVYLALLGWETTLGFPGWTALFLFGTGFLFGGRSPTRVGFMAVVTALALYLFFRTWLRVPLPPSAWF
jgi:putative tricarboxylic transport membrane protein